jgi:hypothetical protein
MCFWPCCSPGNSSRASGSGAVKPMYERLYGSCGRRSRDCFRIVCWQSLMGVIPINPFISRCVASSQFFYPPVRCTRVSRSLALTGLAGQGAGTPLCRPCCVASSAMAKLTLTICFYFRSTETSMMYRVIVASMAQEDPMHSCTLATFPPSPYGCGVLVILTCVSCCDEGLGQVWMRRAHSEPGASRSTARTICAGSPRARSMYVPSSLRPSPKKLWGLFGEGGGATSLVAHLNVSDDGYAPVFGLPFDRA